jgi:hypothetical protein
MQRMATADSESQNSMIEKRERTFKIEESWQISVNSF